MNWEALVGILALIVAAFSALTSWTTSRRQVKLQERLLSLEHTKERERKSGLAQAQLRADILPSHNHSYRLRIRNEGPGQARAIKVLIDGTPLEESDRVMSRGEVIRTLGSGADVKYHIMSFMGMNPLFFVRLEWADDSGADRDWESQLKI